jgi:hypothetical protein
MINLNQKLIIVSSKKESEKHGYTGWSFIYQKVGIFVNTDTELCEYDKFRDVTVFSIKDCRFAPCGKELCFYEVSAPLKPLVADALMILTSMKNIPL